MMIENTTAPTLNFVRHSSDMEHFLVKFMLPYNAHKGLTFTWIEVPAEVNPHTFILFDTKTPAFLTEKKRRSTVKCLLIKPNEMRCEGQIVIHSHGGAFLAGSAKADCATVCADRVFALGVPFILPDYALAPEHPYPAAVQDVLDVYMFLVSDSPKVAEMIGFTPKEIMLSGASAGAAMSLATLFALNSIKKTYPALNLKMPCGINVQFPATMVAFIALPSTLVYDFLCTPHVIFLAASFYAECDPRLKDEKWIFRPNAKEVMSRFDGRSQDSLYNPMAFTEWHDLKDIPLSILACEMDTLLDHSVILYKKWVGPKDFDLEVGKPHGFITNQKVINRMAQQFQIKI